MYAPIYTIRGIFGNIFTRFPFFLPVAIMSGLCNVYKYKNMSYPTWEDTHDKSWRLRFIQEAINRGGWAIPTSIMSHWKRNFATRQRERTLLKMSVLSISVLIVYAKNIGEKFRLCIYRRSMYRIYNSWINKKSIKTVRYFYFLYTWLAAAVNGCNLLIGGGGGYVI